MRLIKRLKSWLSKRMSAWFENKASEGERFMLHSDFLTDSERNMESRYEEDVRSRIQD